jgi:hypothetical protein
MKWINRKDQEPGPELKYILVWENIWDKEPQVAHHRYGCWCYYFGGYIKFEFWCPIPQSPYEMPIESKDENKCNEESLNAFLSLKHIRFDPYEDSLS